MNLKVQVIGRVSVKSAVESGFEEIKNPLTFHAFTDEFKARVLEYFLKSPAQIAISITDEDFRDGEWHEPLAGGAIFNRPV